MKKLLILKAGSTLESLRCRVGDFEDWITAGMKVNPEHTVCSSVYLGESLPALDSVAGIVVTGSPAMITDGAPWNNIAMAYLREAVEKKLPVLGICYGHQLLAAALGGKVDYNPIGRAIGSISVSRITGESNDPLLNDISNCFIAHTSHSQSVTELPPGAVPLAFSYNDGHYCFRYGESAWGVQFHPEFDTDIMRQYVIERKEEIEAEGQEVDTILANISDTPEAAKILSRFAQLAGY
ncbi:MAG: glutamine amidotransferase [Pseudohongiellaceae bacterium]|nr:glutamine amidotransferase [Pseudohongiellaceae bacterium]